MKVIYLRHFNIDIALKILLLLGFSSFFLYTIVSGTTSLYVHPRIIPYMIFASVAMTVIALLLLGDLFQPRKKKVNAWPLLFFIVPLIMAFVLPATAFNASTGTVGDVQLSSGETESNSSDQSAQDTEDTDNPAESDAGSTTDGAGETEASETPDGGLQLQDGVLVMDSSNFYACFIEVYTNIDKYVGTPIEVVGFVFNENEKLADDEFVPARLMMVCCAADMQPVGFLCRYDKASELSADSWVKVTGAIGKTTFEGDTIPYIEAESVEITEDPNEGYIYPY